MKVQRVQTLPRPPSTVLHLVRDRNYPEPSSPPPYTETPDIQMRNGSDGEKETPVVSTLLRTYNLSYTNPTQLEHWLESFKFDTNKHIPATC
jgi:hypothetical protein